MRNFEELGVLRYGGAKYVPRSWPMPIFVNGALLDPILFVLDFLVDEQILPLSVDPLLSSVCVEDGSLMCFVHTTFFFIANNPRSIEGHALRPRILKLFSEFLTADWEYMSQQINQHLNTTDGWSTLDAIRTELYLLLDAVGSSDIVIWGAPESESDLSELRKLLNDIDPNVVQKYFLFPHMDESFRFCSTIETECLDELRKAEAIFDSRNG